MTTYHEALNAQPKDRQDDVIICIERLRNKSNISQRLFCDNLEKERNLQSTHWEAIFDALLVLKKSKASRKISASDVESSIRAVFSGFLLKNASYPHVIDLRPVGPPIDNLTVEAFGRIAKYDEIVARWQNTITYHTTSTSGISLDRQHAEQLVRLMTDAKAFAAFRPHFDEFPLGQYIMWSTFDEKKFGREPFNPKPKGTKSAIETAGLHDSDFITYARRPQGNTRRRTYTKCVLLRYKLDTKLKPHVPTIVEAYVAKGPMNYFFKVITSDVNVKKRIFPRTTPHPNRRRFKGYPEVVHSLVFADSLISPIEIIED